MAIKLDLSIPGNVAKLFNATITAYKRIDVLANVAGIGNFAAIQAPNFNEVYIATRTINEEAAIELTRLAAPYIQSSHGSIIFTTSLLARNPVGKMSSCLK